MRTCKILFNVIENFDFSTLPSPVDIKPQQIYKGNTYFGQGILEHVKRRPVHALNYYLSGTRLGHGDCMFGIYVLTHDYLDDYREFLDKEYLSYSSNYFSEYSDSIYPTLDLLSGDKDTDFYGINQYINSGEMPLTQEAVNFIMSSAYIPYIRGLHFVDLDEDDSDEDLSE